VLQVTSRYHAPYYLSMNGTRRTAAEPHMWGKAFPQHLEAETGDDMSPPPPRSIVYLIPYMYAPIPRHLCHPTFPVRARV